MLNIRLNSHGKNLWIYRKPKVFPISIALLAGGSWTYTGNVFASLISQHWSRRNKQQRILWLWFDDHTTNVSLEEALKPDVLLAHSVYVKQLLKEHGGPVRMITPQL